MTTKIKCALLSVSDKTGILEIARELKKNNVEIISSGGTGTFLAQNDIAFTNIEDVTGNPEAFGGRMKTISFQVGSGLLFRRDHQEDVETAQKLGIKAIDLVVCNLYPFSQVAKAQGDWAELIENIDIGGPTMIRAAAKNHNHVVVLVNPSQYQTFLEHYASNDGETQLDFRKEVALQAYEHMALYDSTVAMELARRMNKKVTTHVISPLNAQTLRYGENPHQAGVVVSHPLDQGIASIVPIQGKELSYNNLLDADSAWRSVVDLNRLTGPQKKFAVSVVKHSTPCGLSIADNQMMALEKAWAGDSISAFGGIIAFNSLLEKSAAQFLSEKFIEVVVAPDFSPEALELFSKKKNVRLLKVPMVDRLPGPMIRSIFGGYVVQEEDNGREGSLECVTKNKLSDSSYPLVEFGILCCKHLKSNAIALVMEESNCFSMIGAGMGNPNRLVSVTQAVDKAHENGHRDLSHAFLISDAFFPFADTVEAAHAKGINLFIQPGGSIKDQEVVACANKMGATMVMTGMRHFRH